MRFVKAMPNNLNPGDLAHEAVCPEPRGVPDRVLNAGGGDRLHEDVPAQPMKHGQSAAGISSGSGRADPPASAEPTLRRSSRTTNMNMNAIMTAIRETCVMSEVAGLGPKRERRPAIRGIRELIALEAMVPERAGQKETEGGQNRQAKKHLRAAD
jgi:hypothetical protein